MGRWTVMAAAALTAAWFGGFAAFVAGLPDPDAEPAVADVEAVAVLTGGGGARIKKAMAIFSAGAGARLLISGVHPDTALDDLKALWTGPDDRFVCCIDTGVAARTTKGNAEEIAAWAKARGFGRVAVVTSDYHLPRTLLELRRAAPGLAAVPVAAPSPRGLKGWRRLHTEYAKFQVRRAGLLVEGRPAP